MKPESLPATVARFRETLLSLVNRLAESKHTDPSDSAEEELKTGWQLLKRLPAINRTDSALTYALRASNASASSSENMLSG